MRRAQLAWALLVAGGWAHATSLAVFAYGAGGAGAVGLALLIRSAPAALGAPVTGLAARLPLRVALPLSGVLTALCVAASAGAAAAGSAGAVYALSAAVTLATMLFRQAHSALLPALAPPGGGLTAANATATTIESVGMVAGPAVAGALLAFSSVPAVLAFAAATSAAAVAVIAGCGGDGRAAGDHGSLLAGFREAAATPAVRLVLGLLLVQTLVSGALNVLFVVCAIELLELGREGTSVLTVAFGLGGLAGGLAAFVRAAGADLVAWLRAGLVLWGLPLVCLGLVPEPHLALGLICAVGLGNALFDVASVTLVQRALTGTALARVLGVLETVVVVGLALGAGAASLAIAQLGVRGALVALGAIMPLALVVSHRPIGGLRAAPAAA